MKRIFALATVALLGLASSATAQDVKTLRLGWGTSLDGAGGTAAKRFAEVLKEKTNGRLQLALFPNNQLGGEVEMLSQIRSGNLDLGMIGAGVTSSVEPSVLATILPFIWKSRESFWKTINGPVGDKILANFDSKGIKGLAWGTWGERAYLTAGYPVTKPSDLKGKKIRVTQAQLYMKDMELLGAVPTPIPTPEVYTALQTKTVTGVETSIWSAPEFKFHEVTSDIAVTKHQIETAVFMMNGAAFNALSPADQKAMLEAAKAGGQAHYDAIMKQTDEAVTFLTKQGMKVGYPDLAPFREILTQVYDLYKDQAGLIAEIKAAQN